VFLYVEAWVIKQGFDCVQVAVLFSHRFEIGLVFGQSLHQVLYGVEERALMVT